MIGLSIWSAHRTGPAGRQELALTLTELDGGKTPFRTVRHVRTREATAQGELVRQTKLPPGLFEVTTNECKIL